MRIKNIEHVYTVDGTEAEVREMKARLYEKYEQVDVYPTPYDDRIVCTGCKGYHKDVDAIVECGMCSHQIDIM